MSIEEKSIEIDQFVDKLLEEKNLPELGPEVLAEMKKDLVSRVEDRINTALIFNMSPEQLQRFNQLLDSDNESETQAFLKTEIPDLETVIASALINFRATYLGLNS